MRSRVGRWVPVLLIACVIGVVGCGKPDPLASFPEPPTPPEGYATFEEAMAAVMSGKVPIVVAQDTVPEGVKELLDVEYGRVGDRVLPLDLYLPESASKPVPVLIFIHGGGWTSGNKQDYRYYNVRFAEKGYATATMAYRFSQEARFPAAVEDAKCAVRFLRANAAKYNIDPEKIAVIGGSAGGYLSMMVGYAPDEPDLEGTGGHAGVSSRVQAVVNLYGPTDLTWERARKEAVVHKFLGRMFDEDPELYAKASPITYVTKNAPPTLVLHGSVDQTVPVEQSDGLVEKLKELGVPVVYGRLEGWPHTMDLAQPVNDHCCFYFDNFFARVLPLPE
ncbi:MAG: alpha/beta hydrolase [bacterium]|nr:alpha/beta hydrolase [bacterium]